MIYKNAVIKSVELQGDWKKLIEPNPKYQPVVYVGQTLYDSLGGNVPVVAFVLEDGQLFAMVFKQNALHRMTLEEVVKANGWTKVEGEA
jgi:hypothetical protein